MKVGIISIVYPYPNQGINPGIERHVYNLSKSLEKKGLEVHVFTSFWNGGKANEMDGGIYIHRFVETKKLFGKFGCLFDLHFISFARSIFKSDVLKQCDVILAITAMYNIDKLRHKNKVPILSFFHHADNVQKPIELLYLPFSDYIEKKCHTESNLALTPSYSSKKVLTSRYGIKTNHIKVVPHGFDSTFITDKYNPTRKFKNQIELLYVGPIIPRKGILYLIEAIHKVKEKYESITLFIVGEGPDRIQYEELSSNLGLDKNIIFAGFVSELNLKSRYENCDIFVFPSLNEGFGQVLVEAMVFGKAIIATNSSSIPEIIGDSGILIEPKNTDDLASAIITLIDDENLRIELGNKAYKRVMEKYTWDKISDEYTKIFDEMIDKY